jgi:hypothetical protein
MYTPEYVEPMNAALRSYIRFATENDIERGTGPGPMCAATLDVDTAGSLVKSAMRHDDFSSVESWQVYTTFPDKAAWEPALDASGGFISLYVPTTVQDNIGVLLVCCRTNAVARCIYKRLNEMDPAPAFKEVVNSKTYKKALEVSAINARRILTRAADILGSSIGDADTMTGQIIALHDINVPSKNPTGDMMRSTWLEFTEGVLVAIPDGIAATDMFYPFGTDIMYVNGVFGPYGDGKLPVAGTPCKPLSHSIVLKDRGHLPVDPNLVEISKCTRMHADVNNPKESRFESVLLFTAPK